MEGVRVLEVAQFTFVPAAGAILADWGADVIKVEHPVRGDTQRGFINMGGFQLDPNRHPLMEHPNRGKRVADLVELKWLDDGHYDFHGFLPRKVPYDPPGLGDRDAARLN